MNVYIGFIGGIFLTLIILLSIYFGLINKKVCNKKNLIKCPNSDVEICSDDTDVNKYCGSSPSLLKTRLSQLKARSPLLNVGPGNGQCVGPTEKQIQDKDACNDCISDGQSYYDENLSRPCVDSYSTGYGQAQNGDVVAYNYGPNPYTCESPGMVTDNMPRGGMC